LGGATVAATLVESAVFGAAGTLVLGGLAFPPVGAALLGIGAGAFCISGLTLLISKLLERGRFKALAYLEEMLAKLNELSKANQEFFKEMCKSEEEANTIKEKMEFIRQNVKTGSKRFLNGNRDICLQVIDSINEIIASIYCIKNIDLSEWTEHDRRLPAAILDRSLSR
jgi:hypothetical protein